MTLDVFADLACPWCYIGDARLQRALDARPHLQVERRWRPFQLQPDLPPWQPWQAFAARKFGSAERARALFATVTEIGRREGLTFAFDAMPTAPNTADAHRLVLLGEAHGRAFETARAFFRGYFAEGRNLNDPADLVALAEAAGLPGAEAREVLAGDRFRDRVEKSQQAARRLGFAGVPFYVFDRQYTLSGAQPTEVFVEQLDRMATAGMEEPG
ncbi:MAG TPA: DsbA family oxidoreductase [Rubricoccaceae bacterium]|nr:DsbA family oxidoreductase [Rubricoccaceae bacterium]